jgi:hypothetical protein
MSPITDVRSRAPAIQHVGHDQPEYMVAQKFEPLIAIGTAACGFLQSGNVSKGGRQQRRIGKVMTDAGLDGGSFGLGGRPAAPFFGRRGLCADASFRARAAGVR